MRSRPKHNARASRRTRLTVTRAHARISALQRDSAFFQRFLAGDSTARKEMERLLRIVAPWTVGEAAAKERLRIQEIVRKIGEDAVSRLSWLVDFAQLKPEELTPPGPPKPIARSKKNKIPALLLSLENLDDVKAFARGPFPR